MVPTTPPGTVIGRYTLLEHIGEGGCGTVFMAEQTAPVQRNVALKIIKAGMDTRQLLARFEAERQTLALMDHPNIARVFDAGVTDTGRPYFVMELVEGRAITQYCDDHHLPPRARLELFVQVCRAVQHAHQKGIIHRDLKPSNVLVAEYDGKPVPKVIDFGIAKATGERLADATMFTGYGDVVGTLEYMSPEQAEVSPLDVDTRSDVYSLGVLLYELLTGSTPLERGRARTTALLEMLRVVREEEPPKPSTRLTSTQELPSIATSRGLEPAKLRSEVQGELDWIVMKALEKDRNRRYETAIGFARDVERYLADEAVHACPPSAYYRFRKFSRRNRAPLATAAALAAALLVGSAVSVWQATRARHAERLAQVRLVAQAAEAAKANAISGLLLDALAAANPEQSNGSDYTVRHLLDDLSHRLDAQLIDQPLTSAAVHSVIGNAYRRLGVPRDAEPHLLKALELRRRLLGTDHPDVATSLVEHAYNLFEFGDPAAAEAEARLGLATFRRAGVRDDRVLGAFAELIMFVGNQGRTRDAQAIGDEARAFATSVGITESPQLAKLLHNMAGFRVGAADLAGAERLGVEAVAMHRRVSGREHPETAWALLFLGDVYRREGRRDDAIACVGESLALFRKYYPDSHRSVVSARRSLTDLLTAKGDQAALATLLADQADGLRKALQRDPGDLNLRTQLAATLCQAGDLDNAIAAYTDLLGRRSPGTAPGIDAEIGAGCSRLARLLRDEHRSVDAESAFRQAIAVRSSLLEKVPTPRLRLDLANDYNDLAFALRPIGERRAEAERLVRTGLALKQALVEEFPDNLEYRTNLAHSHLGLGHLAAGAGRRSDAADAYRDADATLAGVAVDASTPQGTRKWLRDVLGQLDRAWLRIDRPDEAARVRERAGAVPP